MATRFGKPSNTKSTTVYGGASINKQVDELPGSDIVLDIPGYANLISCLVFPQLYLIQEVLNEIWERRNVQRNIIILFSNIFAFFLSMVKGDIIVNVGRSEIVDRDGMIQFLNENKKKFIEILCGSIQIYNIVYFI